MFDRLRAALLPASSRPVRTLSLRDLVDTINEGLVTVDRSRRITWVNRALCDMTGYAPGDIVGHDPLEFVDADNARIFRTEFGSRQAGSARRYEIDWLRRDGTPLHTLVAPQPLFDGAGRFSGSVAVVSDVTALKNAERALRSSERQFRELVDHASSIVLRWDADGTIRFINPWGLSFFGYEKSEVVGRNVIGTIVPETDSGGLDLGAMIADIGVRPERYVYNENETRDRAGRRFWVVWTNRGLRDDAGRITGVLSIGTDITELKRAREELARQRDELAELNEFIRRIFGRYVSEAVVRRLLDSPEGLEPGGSTRRVTILVADVRGFSSLCESLEPEQIVALLNSYLEGMTDVIERHEGTIDEFIGDGILVLFGAPFTCADHAGRAVACALDMQIAMEDVNERNRACGLPALEVGIGIHTGDAVIGSIGGVRRAKYGAVGTSVNLAARIESFTVGGQILISDDTRAAAGDALVLGSCLHVEPKGVRAPLAVHEVRGMTGATPLFLPDAGSPPCALLRPAPCAYAVMEEKFVGRTAYAGSLTRLSVSGAELLAVAPLPLLANLRLRLTEAGGAELYAKVVAHREGDPTRLELRFTSISSTARAAIEALLAGRAAPARAGV